MIDNPGNVSCRNHLRDYIHWLGSQAFSIEHEGYECMKINSGASVASTGMWTKLPTQASDQGISGDRPELPSL